METIKACHKEYEIKQIICDDHFLCERKGKQYFIRKYEPYLEEGKLLAFQAKKVTNCGIKTPKLIGIDKKNGYIVCEYIDGTNLVDILSKEDLSEDVYKQLFHNAYMAKISKMTLDYQPIRWMLKDGVLYYTYLAYIKYNHNEDLALKYLPLYFNTKELANYMQNHNVFYDKNRIEPNFDTNKQMALITCQYYK